MIAYCPTLDAAMVSPVPANTGSSEAANLVARLVRDGFLHYARPRIELLMSDIEGLVTSPEFERVGEDDPTPIDIQTAEAAIAFALLLPQSLPIPEVAPEADGDISFDWLGPFGKMFSVSINRNGRIAYAGRFGEKSKIRGTEQLLEICPPEITRGIAKAIS